jgi:hypothetical protein
VCGASQREVNKYEAIFVRIREYTTQKKIRTKALELFVEQWRNEEREGE